MQNFGKLAGKTIFITGASRGIGKAIAVKAAADGANIIVAAKTAEPHPTLPGTIFTTAEEVEKAGGKALPVAVDVRDESAVRSAIESAAEKFGGIDILVNNASAFGIATVEENNMKRYDLMHQVIARGTFLVSKQCLPHLKRSSHAHILNIAPPLRLEPRAFSRHFAFTSAKYCASMSTLGMAEKLRPFSIAVNALWPQKLIYTSPVEVFSGRRSFDRCRKPEAMADAAYAIIVRDPSTYTGNFYTDEEVLRAVGVADLADYACNREKADELVDVETWLGEVLAKNDQKN